MSRFYVCTISRLRFFLHIFYVDLTTTIDNFMDNVAINTTNQAATLLRSPFEQVKPEADEQLDLSPREIWYKTNDQAKFERNEAASDIVIVRQINDHRISIFPDVYIHLSKIFLG